MCLPSVSWSSVALATPSANSTEVRAAFFIIPLDSYLAQIRSKCSVRLKSKCLQFLRNGADGSFLFFVSLFAFFFFFRFGNATLIYFKYHALDFVKTNTTAQTTENKRKTGFNPLLLS